MTKGNQFFGHAAEAFDGKEMAFAAACEKLGGRKINSLAYVIYSAAFVFSYSSHSLLNL